jgi:hypothetical protein
MKKIANFTQTYRTIPQFTSGTDGVNREFLIDYQLRDKTGLWWRKNLDLHTFSFHNWDEEAAKRLGQKILNVLPNTEFFCYNNMTYGETFHRHLTYLKKQGITDVLWIQDDEFTIFSDIMHLKAFLDFYKKREDIKCVYLGVSKQALKFSTADDIGEQIDYSLFIYKTKCEDFHKLDNHAFPMGNCICNIDILLSFIKNEQEFEATDNYTYEYMICQKGLAQNLQRCVLNIPFFKAYNVVGMGGSLGSSKTHFNELIDRFD